jgi:hypothetical protein
MLEPRHVGRPRDGLAVQRLRTDGAVVRPHPEQTAVVVGHFPEGQGGRNCRVDRLDDTFTPVPIDQRLPQLVQLSTLVP